MQGLPVGTYPPEGERKSLAVGCYQPTKMTLGYAQQFRCSLCMYFPGFVVNDHLQFVLL